MLSRQRGPLAVGIPHLRWRVFRAAATGANIQPAGVPARSRAGDGAHDELSAASARRLGTPGLRERWASL